MSEIPLDQTPSDVAAAAHDAARGKVVYLTEHGERLAAIVAAHAAKEPLAPGMPAEAARAALRVPDRRLVEALAAPSLVLSEGLLRAAPRPGTGPAGARAAPRTGAAAAPAEPVPLTTAPSELVRPSRVSSSRTAAIAPARFAHWPTDSAIASCSLVTAMRTAPPAGPAHRKLEHVTLITASAARAVPGPATGGGDGGQVRQCRHGERPTERHR